MNIENLYVGQVISNYKELCVFLDEEVKAGNSRKYQLLEWQRYFSYEKRGHKFIIKEIYNKVLKKIDNRIMNGNTTPYTKDVELLLIDLMLCSDGEITLPNSSLMLALKMVNRNYSKYYSYNRPLLADNLNIDINIVNEYYENVSSSLNSNINNVIKRLEKKFLVYHKEVIMLKIVENDPTSFNENGTAKLNTYNTKKDGIEKTKYFPEQIKTVEKYREATNREIRMILKIKRETMVSLGFNSEDTYDVLYKNGLVQKFHAIVNKRLLKELNILYSFNAHNLIFNNDHLEYERLKILDEIEKSLIESSVNKSIRDRIIDNAKNRSHKASQILMDTIMRNEDVPDKVILRNDEKYIDNYELLNGLLINHNSNIYSESKLINEYMKDEDIVLLELPELM